MKKNLFLIILLFSLFLITGCGNTKEYTVEFITDSIVEVETQTVKSGTKLTEPTNITKVGYTLDGWYNKDTKWDFTKDKVVEDLKLTAKWTLKENVVKATIMQVKLSGENVYLVEGLVLARSNKVIIIKDSSAMMTIYDGENKFDYVKIGDKINVVGKVVKYCKTLEFTEQVEIEVISSDNELIYPGSTDYDLYYASLFYNSEQIDNLLLKFTGTLKLVFTDDNKIKYINVECKDSPLTISISKYQNMDELREYDGKEIKFSAVNASVTGNNKFLDVVLINLTK